MKVNETEQFEYFDAPPSDQNYEYYNYDPNGGEAVKRGFLENVWEAGKRGRKGVLADIAIYDALQDPTIDLEGVMNYKKILDRGEALDPVDGNWLADRVYGAAGIMGQWWENIKQAGFGATIGAGIGAGVGALAGLVIPTVGEEPLTIAGGALAGAKVGAKLFGTEASAIFAYRQGVGSMYASMREQGVEHDTAERVSKIAGIPYALVEMAQIGTAAKPIMGAITGKSAQKALGKSASNLVLKFAKKWGTTWLEETGEEGIQEIIQITAEDAAKKSNGIVDDKTLADKSKRVLDVLKQAGGDFLLFPVPGSAIETASIGVGQETQVEIEQTLKDIEDSSEITPEEMASPILQLDKELMNVSKKLLQENDIKEPVPSKPRTKPLTEKEITKISELKGVSELEASQMDLQEAQSILKPTGLPESERGVGKVLKEQEALRKEEFGGRMREAEAELESQAETKASWYKTVFKKLKGEYKRFDITPLKETLSLDTFDKLSLELSQTDRLSKIEAAKTAQALEKLFTEGRLPAPHIIKYISKQWGPQVAEGFRNIKYISENPEISITDVLSVPKATASALDLSRTLRQNNMIAGGNMKLWLKSIGRDMKTMIKDEGVARALEKKYLMTLGDSRRFIRWNEWGEGSTYQTGAERFPSRFVGKLPKPLRTAIQATERAYTLGGNILRAELMQKYVEKYGGPENLSEKQLRDIGHVINLLTGEGDARWLGQHAATLNALFFAPRWTMSKLQIWSFLMNPKNWTTTANGKLQANPAIKVMAWHVGTHFALMSSLLAGFAAVPGADVEWKDPTSSDWGKVQFGNTRVDLWGGDLPFYRLIAQLTTGKRKTQSGRSIPQDRLETVTRFMQSKLGPAPAFVLDMLRGETFYGQEVPRTKEGVIDQFYQRFTPFFIQDIVDSFHYSSPTSTLATAPLAFFGAGVQTYESSPSAQIVGVKNQVSLQVLGKKWDDIGPDAQKLLEANFPQIGQMEAQANYERTSYSFLNKIAKERQQSENRITKSLPKDVQHTLESLGIRTGGLARSIGSGWYLNNKRFKEYESKVKQLIILNLPKIVRNPKWDKVDPVTKAELLKEVIESIKKSVRQSIALKANISDIQQLQDFMKEK